jgi:hypothetical protein
MCGNCIVLFPYNHIMDDNVFKQATKNKNTRTYVGDCNNLLFNPFEFPISGGTPVMNMIQILIIILNLI